MRLEGNHLASDQLLIYYLSLSILKGETLLISNPTPQMLDLVREVAPFAKASLKGAGRESEECIFVPSKIVKKQELELQGSDPLPLLKVLLPAFVFCGHKVSITLIESGCLSQSPYYIRDVLLPYLHRYLDHYSFSIEPTGDLKLIIKGRYLLDGAPPFILRKKESLVAIRGELELEDESMVKFIDLGLKDFKVPIRLHHTISAKNIIHLDALYGGVEGYDNDFAYILYEDSIGDKKPQEVLSLFREKLSLAKLSQELIEDLLLYVGLLGGSLPTTYEEIDFMLDELNKELNYKIENNNGIYH